MVRGAVSVLAISLLTFFATSVSGQSPAPEPDSTVAAQTAPAPAPATQKDRYRDGMIIWETPEDAQVPFLLKFNINTQLRYLNTLDSDDTYTDHLGLTRDVHKRNDITVDRAMFILGGYVFDQRAR
jgi:hypothetical protein